MSCRLFCYFVTKYKRVNPLNLKTSPEYTRDGVYGNVCHSKIKSSSTGQEMETETKLTNLAILDHPHTWSYPYQVLPVAGVQLEPVLLSGSGSATPTLGSLGIDVHSVGSMGGT